jgi:hypothetical protein
MNGEHHFWVIDPRVVEYVKFAKFHIWELWAIAIVLGALGSYALLALVLDRQARIRRRRQRQLARLETWLSAFQLEPDEEEALWSLSGDGRPHSLYAVLSDPGRFERAVHEALSGGEPMPFLERVRDELGYRSDNLSAPVVSTRQLMPGDHLRFTVWEEGRPQHHYGFITAVSPGGVAVELTEAGFRDVTTTKGMVELFYLRSNDLEVRLPFVLRSTDAERHRLLLAHQLVRGGQRPRSTRLPMLRAITFRLHAAQAAPPLHAPGEQPEPGQPLAGAVPGQELRAALLEMSEGGFSMVTLQPIAEGAYVEYALPLPRSRVLPLVARVLDCRPFAGNRWLVRCELRGLLPSQRNLLSQVLRLEQRQRLRAIQAERRKRRREESDAS